MKTSRQQPTPKQLRYISSGGVVIEAGRMLLLDRPSRGEIRLPKGHIDPGESPAETALRETCEESGYADLEIVLDLGEQVVTFEYEGKQVVRTEHYFLMRLGSDRTVPRTPKDEEQFRVLWLPVEQAVEQLTYAAEQDVARRAILAGSQV